MAKEKELREGAIWVLRIDPQRKVRIFDAAYTGTVLFEDLVTHEKFRISTEEFLRDYDPVIPDYSETKSKSKSGLAAKVTVGVVVLAAAGWWWRKRGR